MDVPRANTIEIPGAGATGAPVRPDATPHRGDDPFGLHEEILALRAELELARIELADSRLLEQRARHSSLHDALTGLPNRSAFDAHARLALQDRLASGRPFALLYFDLDGFKAINDAHGHAAGDALLRVVGSRLAHAMRADDVVCRYGGDEFLGLVLGLDDERRAAQIARELAAVIATPCAVVDATVEVHASIGIAMHPRDGTTLEALVASADAAMFRAKRDGSGHAFVAAADPGAVLLP